MKVLNSKTLFILILKVCVLNSQFHQSPCPNIFQYGSDGRESYGIIQVIPSGSYSKIIIIVNFTIAAALPSSYVGKLEYAGDTDLNDLEVGSPVRYRVHFPLRHPIPRLTSLMVNNEVLCYGPGDTPGPGEYVSTITLQHTIFLSGNGFGQPFVQNKPMRLRPMPPVFVDKMSVPFLIIDGNGNPIHQNSGWIDNNRNNDDDDRFRPEVKPVLPTDQNRRPGAQSPSFESPDYEMGPSFDIAPQRPHSPTTAQVPFTSRPMVDSFFSSSSHSECGMVAGGNEKAALIYNGDSYDRGEWPWLVAIYRRKDGSLNFICSGSLISDRHVVTAAHCMHQKSSYSSIKDIVIRVGVFNLEDWGDEISVTRTLKSAHIHDNYDSRTLSNDLLIMSFTRKVDFNENIRAVCLWSGKSELRLVEGKSGVVTGWGKSELGPSGRGEPRAVNIPIVSTSTCRASKPDFHKLTSNTTFCAGDRNGAGPCLGDSGGGMYLYEGGRWRIRGVVSLSLRPENGDNTCNLNEYVVFTDTAQYMPWINYITTTF